MNNFDEASRTIIEIDDGPICGYIEKENEKTIYNYKSIPYAKPPLGNLRFLVSTKFISIIYRIFVLNLR